MAPPAATRSDRKHRSIVEAATALFLEKGYLGTSMDDIAALAVVSKQTVYKHFSDKEQLFGEIVLSATTEVDGMVRAVAEALSDTRDVDQDLRTLARRFLTTLMEPRLVRLRRLVIASAYHFPDLGRTWYERGFEPVLATLATSFEQLADQGLLRREGLDFAPDHFVGLLLWIPVNKAMFIADHDASSTAELERYTDAAVRAFLGAYAPRESS